MEVTMYKCPECGVISTREEWNDTTSRWFVEEYYPIEENGIDCFYICPCCDEEVLGCNIEEMVGNFNE